MVRLSIGIDGERLVVRGPQRAAGLARWLLAHKPAVMAALATTPADLPPAWREVFEERAAIREFDGRQPRPMAEREAFQEVVARMTSAVDTDRTPRGDTVKAGTVNVNGIGVETCDIAHDAVPADHGHADSHATDPCDNTARADTTPAGDGVNMGSVNAQCVGDTEEAASPPPQPGADPNEPGPPATDDEAEATLAPDADAGALDDWGAV